MSWRVVVAGLIALGLAGRAEPVRAEALRVQGTVRSAAGGALAGAHVDLTPVLPNHTWNRLLLDGATAVPPVASVEADAAGRFTLTVPAAGIWRIEVRAAGFVPMRYFPLPVTGPVELPPVSLVRDVGSRVAVVDGAGAAVAGVWIVAEPGDRSVWSPWAVNGWSVASRIGRPDGTGVLTPPRMEGESLLVTVRRPGSLASVQARAEGQARLALSGDAGPARPIEVRGEGGEPLEGVVVVAGEPAWPVGVTDRDGRLIVHGNNGERIALHLHGRDGRRAKEWLPAAAAGGEVSRFVLAAPTLAGGRVLGEARRPLAGALVWAGHDPGLAVMTDPEGRYRIVTPPGESFWVQAEAAGYLPENRRLAPEEARAGNGPTLALTPAVEVGGRVVDQAGAPLAGVRLEAFAVSRPPTQAFHPDRAESRSMTDAEGRFRLAGLHPAGSVDLAARKEGFGPRTVRGIEVPSVRASFDLGTLVLTPGAVVDGAVRDRGGRPIAGAEVWAEADRGGPPPGASRLLRGQPAAVTGTDGRFRIADLERGRRIHLAARREGYVPAIARGVEAPSREPVALVLDPAARVSGLVVTGEGTPVAGAAVGLAGARPVPGVAGVPRRSSEDARSAVTDTAGRFTLDEVAPGAFELSARAEGYQPAKPVALEIAPGKPVEGVRLVLVPGATLEGLVSDASGKPVAEALVSVGPAEATSDADGRYRATGIPPGPQRADVRHRAYNRLSKRLDIEPGTQVEDFVLGGGMSVAGRVVDEAGEAVAEARLRLQLREARDVRDYDASTGALGRFQFPAVADGVYELVAEREGYAPAHVEGVKVAGLPVEDVAVVLRRGGAIAGRLLGLGPDELAAAEVEAVQGEAGARAGRVDHRGSYEVADLAPGDWLVRARVLGRSRQAEARVTLEPGARQATRDLEFSGGLMLTGQVFYGESPLPEARVTLTGFEAALERTTATGLGGRFLLEGLEPGAYRISVSSPRELLNYNEQVELSRDTEVRIDIPTARVSGSIVSAATAQPVPGAVVYLQQLGGAGADQPGSVINVVTDARGSFLLARVTAGRHRLFVRKDGYAPAEQAVEVAAGTALEGLEIPLEPTEGLDLQVRFASGTVPAFVVVGALDAAGRLVAAEGGRPDAEGRAHIANVPAGSWQLWISAAGGVAARVPATVPGPPVRAVLPAAGRVHVRVPTLVERNLVGRLVLVDPAGRVFEDLDDTGALRREWFLLGGSGTVDGLPPGPWTARVTSPDGQMREAAVTVAPGVETSVEIP